MEPEEIPTNVLEEIIRLRIKREEGNNYANKKETFLNEEEQ